VGVRLFPAGYWRWDPAGTRPGLAASNPALARELTIGRPDLARDYDDGGLADVNHVPGRMLAAGLGLASTEVTDVLGMRPARPVHQRRRAVRRHRPGPDRVDGLRDLMLFR
jgi:hypothetical protein